MSPPNHPLITTQVLAYPTLRFRCLAVCDINIKAAEVEQGGGSGSGEVKDCGIGGEVKGDGGGWEEGRGGDGGTCSEAMQQQEAVAAGRGRC